MITTSHEALCKDITATRMKKQPLGRKIGVSGAAGGINGQLTEIETEKVSILVG